MALEYNMAWSGLENILFTTWLWKHGWHFYPSHTVILTITWGHTSFFLHWYWLLYASVNKCPMCPFFRIFSVDLYIRSSKHQDDMLWVMAKNPLHQHHVRMCVWMWSQSMLVSLRAWRESFFSYAGSFEWHRIWWIRNLRVSLWSLRSKRKTVRFRLTVPSPVPFLICQFIIITVMVLKE